MPPVAKNLRALQGALEHSVTIQRARLQQVMDDLVARGTLTTAEAEDVANRLLASSKDYSAAILAVLDSVMTEARRTLGAGVAAGVAGVAPAVASAGKLAGTVMQAPKLVARAPKAESRPAAPPPVDPIDGYDALTVAEIRPQLAGLTASDLVRVRDQEVAGKSRKSLLAEIDRLLS
jgi:polyhydroxyalkanoate synthesis regulator phasin